MVSGDTDHGDHVVLTIEYGGNTATVYDRDTDHGKGISRKCKKMAAKSPVYERLAALGTPISR